MRKASDKLNMNRVVVGRKKTARGECGMSDHVLFYLGESNVETMVCYKKVAAALGITEKQFRCFMEVAAEKNIIKWIIDL
jgi:tRNA(Glu) U13 pseudouridine synthase TruD